MTEGRVPRLPIEEAKAAADEAGIPDYMAELSIFQVLLNHPTLARAVNDLLATILWHGRLAPRHTRLRGALVHRVDAPPECGCRPSRTWPITWRIAWKPNADRIEKPAKRFTGDEHDEPPPF